MHCRTGYPEDCSHAQGQEAQAFWLGRVKAGASCLPGKGLAEAHIDKIIKTDQFREEEARKSRRVDMAEIEKNDFNLNISRYTSTAVSAAEIDLAATHGELLEIETAIAAANHKHNAFLKALGWSPLT